ncbi:hypothetical protein HMPREF1550_01548 [Actinomyces sp. oral taxon 877 str. F0543]|nr:hypothetical protein HMPREF1550_01548 [Actinomyces sp. oral taxon 877 str. F0543]
MIPAPTITVNGARINSTASAYQTAPTAVAPLSITWGRNNLIGHTSPATATINIDFSPTISIGNYAPLGAKVLITDPDGTPYFVGTIRAIEVTAPTTPAPPPTRKSPPLTGSQVSQVRASTSSPARPTRPSSQPTAAANG